MRQKELLKMKARYAELQQKFIKILNEGASFSRVDEIEYNRLTEILEFHRCPICFKLIPDEDDYVTESFMGLKSRWHRECLKRRDEIAEEARRRRKELKKRHKKLREEIEANKRKGTWTVFRTVTGYKRDYEKLMEDLPNILREYGLEPWERVESP
jgi:hypothetical protein